jgi:drug/metabolite transporter (DMT)-like permease
VQTYHLGRVVFWMIGALLSFSAMAVSIRGLAGVLSVFEILAIRSGLWILILVVLGAWSGMLRTSLIPHRFAMHAVRNSLHFGAQYAWASAILLLPLATVFAIEFTAPAWTALLAAIFLGERLTPSRIAAILLGFVGVLIILRPGLGSFRPAALLVLLAAVGFASTTIATKMLITTETTFAVVLWMNILQLPMALVASDLFFPTRLAMQHLPAVLGIGISGLSAHYCLTNAFRSGDATVVVTIDFLRIPLIAVVGWWLYGESLDAFVFVGAAVIIGGVLWNLRAEARRPIAPASKPLETRADATVGN